MRGDRRLYLVPVARLPKEQLSESAKGYRDEDLKRWMASVPQIQRLRESGWTSSDFDRLRSAANPARRELGETEFQLYRSDSAALKASYDGHQFEVEGGRHRLEAAREQGVDAVPMRVWATPEHHVQLENELGSRQRSVPDRDRSDRDRLG